MNYVVKRLQVELATPESVFVSQDDELTPENSYMYFIAKGDCNVMIKDKVNDVFEEIQHRSLLPGDHFGVRLTLYIFIINLGNIITLFVPEDSNSNRK